MDPSLRWDDGKNEVRNDRRGGEGAGKGPATDPIGGEIEIDRVDTDEH